MSGPDQGSGALPLCPECSFRVRHPSRLAARWCGTCGADAAERGRVMVEPDTRTYLDTPSWVEPAILALRSGGRDETRRPGRWPV